MATGFLLGSGWRWRQFLAEKLLIALFLTTLGRVAPSGRCFNNLIRAFSRSLQGCASLLQIRHSRYRGLEWTLKSSLTQKTSPI